MKFKHLQYTQLKNTYTKHLKQAIIKCTRAPESDKVKQICAPLICGSPVLPNHGQEKSGCSKVNGDAPTKQAKSTRGDISASLPPHSTVEQQPPEDSYTGQEATQFMLA